MEKKVSCRQFCKYLDGRLCNNHWFLLWFVTISMNTCNMVYSPSGTIKKINSIMKKLDLFYCGLIQKVWIFATWCIPSRATRRLKKKKTVIQKYSAAEAHMGPSCLPLLPVFGTIFEKYTKLWQFLYLLGNL